MNNTASLCLIDESMIPILDSTPFGNDVGNDTFYLYRDWRTSNPNKDAKYFLNKTMKELNFSDFNLNTSSNDKQILINNVDKMHN